jgi:hypothetical protein
VAAPHSRPAPPPTRGEQTAFILFVLFVLIALAVAISPH